MLEALVAIMRLAAPAPMGDRQLQTVGALRKVVTQRTETMRGELARSLLEAPAPFTHVVKSACSAE